MRFSILAAAIGVASPARADPNWIRTAVEEASAIGAGAVWYWLTPDKQVADWDYPSVRQRLSLDVWRFDNNTFATNFVWHPFAGTGYHLLARANGFGMLGSVGWGLGTSLAWEYLLEFREKVSINDVIVSSGSGVAAGEFAYWLGRWLAGGRRTTGRNAARWTLGFWHALHEEMDGEPPPPEEIWHRFRLGTAWLTTGATSAGQVHLEGKLVALPGYLEAVSMRRFFADGNVTEMRLRTSVSSTGIGHDFFAETMILGWYFQAIEAGRRTRTVGTPISYHYRREELGAWTDRFALLHLPGLAIDHDLTWGPLRSSMSVRLHLDFAGVDSAAYDDWRAEHAEREKTILRKQGYWFGWGASGRISSETSIWIVSLGVDAFYGTYDSQEGLDRSQEVLTADLDGQESIFDAQGWLRIEPVDPLYLEARLWLTKRDSSLGGEGAGASLGRYGVELGAEL